MAFSASMSLNLLTGSLRAKKAAAFRSNEIGAEGGCYVVC